MLLWKLMAPQGIGCDVMAYHILVFISSHAVILPINYENANVQVNTNVCISLACASDNMNNLLIT